MERTVSCLLAAGFLLNLCGLSGCDRPKEPKPELGKLPRLQLTHHRQLRDELARLRAEQATPWLLDQASMADPNDSPHGGQAAVDRLQQQVADLNTALEDICSAQQTQRLLQELNPLYPTGPFQFGPIKLEQIIQFREPLLAQLEQYEILFRRPGFRFRISLMSGLLADLAILDHATLAHRLEAIGAADALSVGQPQEAIIRLRTMFLVDKKLAELKHVACRLTAAKLRAEAFEVFGAIVQHPQCTELIRQTLLEVVNDQLADWPPDTDAWIGDRALGLHAYELVRDGKLMSLLTSEEINELKSKRELLAFSTALLKSLDDDEWSYLRTMRRVITSCDQPFFQRRETLRLINDELDSLLDTPRYPLFAARVLLADLAQGLEQQAVDRARCEAWALALETAAGTDTDRFTVNPVTGTAYDVSTTEEKVEVALHDSQRSTESIVVPRIDR